MGNTFVRHSKETTTASTTTYDKTKEDEAILRFVMKQMQDANINRTWIPDAIEKQIYINVFRILLANMRAVAETVRIEFLNHVITLKVEAISSTPVLCEHDETEEE